MWRRCIKEVAESMDGCSIIYGSEVFAKGLKKDCCGYYF